MNDAAAPARHRILVIDDNPSIHDDIRKVLCPRVHRNSALSDTKALLFGTESAVSAQEEFEIDSAFQGEEGLRRVQEAAATGRPYALAFVDVRMPPGWDGIETITRIWQEHPELQVVICTAYSDYSWEDMIRQIGRSSSMVVLKKPFDNIEVLQLAHALTEKWNLDRQVRGQLHHLDRLVAARTGELQAANERLTREIAERRLAEKALVLSEERFSKAFNANPIPLAIQSLQRETITDVNRVFVELTGYPREELVGRTIAGLGLWVEPELSQEILARLQRDFAVRHEPCRLRTRTGQLRDILLSVELIELNDETCLLTIMQDITDQLQLEKQLRHSQKMEAVGQLAAGIAHDFNNMLTVIQGNASLLLCDHDESSPDRPLLDGILAAARRSGKLVRQLLAFSHKQVLEVRTLDVGELLGSLGEMLPRMLGEQISVRFEAPPALPPVPVDAGLVEQMLVNLAVNARDAMPSGGTLTIAAAEATLTAEDVRLKTEAHAGRFLRLAVSDTGCGIPPGLLPRIFEPFFTTKPVGKGTGLGLATVYGIAKQHEGWIDVQSEVGRGTTFSVYLPYDRASASEAVPAPQPEAPRAHGTELIFVVEDEETVRSCVTTILESHGYSVVTASSGVEALAAWPRHRQDVDLLLTDIVMPDGVSGVQLADRLLQDRPELKVIFTSGYSRDLTRNSAPFRTQHAFLPKPYQAHVLLHTIRECLDRPGGRPRSAIPEAAGHS